MRVRVVEDDRSIAKFVAAGLRQEGYAVDVADNGVDGLEDSFELKADRTRLRQVLANLIENAVKYTNRDGRIELGATADQGVVSLTGR